ncbi:3-methylfumaryl-CoA hydratase [Rhizobium sp. PP-F2F-G36]|nr:3-methylfumaryl-CoA hydratase [Rhizobium sp. PP-F2F-G36]
MKDADPFAYVGRSRSSDDIVTQQSVDRFVATLSEYVAAVDPQTAPLGYHWCIGNDILTQDELSEDGSTPGLVGPTRHNLPHRVWAGGTIDFHSPIPIGAKVRREERVLAVDTKAGRRGPVCLINLKVEYKTEERLCIEERRTLALINRRSRQGASAEEPKPPPGLVSASIRFDPDPVLLFRYSALTFNSHRIHFDRNYSSLVENVDGLVVQGPLQAAVLLNIGAKANSGSPRRFEYRNLGVLTDHPGSRIDVLQKVGSTVNTAIYDHQGMVTTIASAD